MDDCLQVTWQNLKDHFATVGAVAHADVFSTPDGRSAGCGKVVFEDPASADAAIARLNETVLKGRHIFVREVCHAVLAQSWLWAAPYSTMGTGP